MIKAIIFDMDGVLIEAKDWHYEALNKALSLFGYEISRYDHLVTYDGLPTSKKLEMLSMERGLPRKLHKFINELKQQYTVDKIFTDCFPMFHHEYALAKLKSEGYKLAVGSNSIRNTIDLMMQKSNLKEYLDFFLSNQDVKKGKPDPEIYNKAIERLGLSPKECMIVEDNESITTQYMRSLYEIEKKTVLQHVYEHLSKIDNAEFIFIVKREDVSKYHIDDMIKLLVPNVRVIIAERDTKGSICTCLLAIDSLDDEESLIIVGADQVLNINLNEVVNNFIKNDYDAGTIIFEDIHPKWSYVKLDESGLVIQAAEKRPISKNATTGFYYYKKAKDFLDSATLMIKKGASVNGVYYVAPSLNEMVLKQKKIGTYRVDKSNYFNLKKQSGREEYENYLKGVK